MRSTCAICEATDVTVRHGLVAWKPWATTGGRYQDVDRCTDVEACRQRVKEAGEEWPVEDPKP